MAKESFFHDHGYKYLFSNPTLVRYLITSFVKEEWVKEIDFTRMEKLDKEFIGEEYQSRESDIIYRVDYQGSEAYLFLLIEFQSSVDRFMALRTLHYVCQFYLDILERKNYTFLPPVFPVVLYNGEEKWTAPVEFRELIEEGEAGKEGEEEEGEEAGRRKGLDAYIPKFRYCRIAENEFPKTSLRKLKNLASALFYIENSSSDEVVKAINEIIEIVMNEQDKKAVHRFIIWFRNLVERKRLKDDEGEDYRIYNPEEVRNMLTATLEKLREEGIKEGIEKGIEKGRKEGIEEGIEKGIARGIEKGKKEELVELIRIYLITRFDKAPAALLESLKKVEDIHELERLAPLIYRCQNLEEIESLLGLI
jgi:flagellar biosynthesis/type III secretory pathway protein FliH